MARYCEEHLQKHVFPMLQRLQKKQITAGSLFIATDKFCRKLLTKGRITVFSQLDAGSRLNTGFSTR